MEIFHEQKRQCWSMDNNRVKTLRTTRNYGIPPAPCEWHASCITEKTVRPRGGLGLMPRRPLGSVAVSNDDRVAAAARFMTAVVYLRTAAVFLCARVLEQVLVTSG